jgi:DNA-binding NtrC family response regulator
MMGPLERDLLTASARTDRDELTRPIRVLVVDDEAPLTRALERLLTHEGFEVTTALTGAGALQGIEREPDVVLLDLMLPDASGMDILQHIKRERPDIEVVILTGHGDVNTAVEALHAGAYHFLTKPCNNDAVVGLLGRAAERRRLIHRARKLEEALAGRAGESPLVGSSPAMRQVFSFVETVAHSESTVLLQGESGTGKELVARAIHSLGQRRGKPFVPINCSAIPENLIESELFGHVKGAFTGAAASRRGLFEAADGGTVFLDEVVDLPTLAQVKLLRVLQEGEVRRVGSDETHTVDVRVVSASNTDVRKAMERGAFREDLYYRLNVITIELPPLRQREGDIDLLAQYFLRKYARKANREILGLTPAALDLLRAYHWPGNVRELENAIERAVVLARRELLQPDDFPPNVAAGRVKPRPVQSNARRKIDLPFQQAKESAVLTFETEYVRALLDQTRGNISEAARIAGLDRSNFRRIVRRCAPEPGLRDQGPTNEP